MDGKSADQRLSSEDAAKLRARIWRVNFMAWSADVLTGPPEAPFHGRMIIGTHHIRWAELVNKHRCLNIVAARGHGKSRALSFAYPIWKAAHNPGKRIIILSGGPTQTDRIIRDIQIELESNPRLEHLVPRRKKRWSSDQIVMANGSEISVASFEKQIRGGHPIALVCDDVMSDKDGYSYTLRERHKTHFKTAILGMVMPDTQVINIGTPFHSADLIGEIGKMQGFHTEVFPAILDIGLPTERALWPEVYSLAWLIDQRDHHVGSVEFSRERLCRPVSDGSTLFPSEILENDDLLVKDLAMGGPLEWWQQRVGIRTIWMGCDFAISTNTGADFTVVTVVGLDKNGNRWVIALEAHTKLPFQAQLDIIKDLAARYKPEMIYCEANQSQAVWSQELKRTTGLPIQDFYTGVEKHAVDKGIPRLCLLFQNRKYRFPVGDDRSKRVLGELASQLQGFTYANGRVINSGEHDDMAMALWITERAISSDSHFQFGFCDESSLQDASDEDPWDLGDKTIAPDEEDFFGLRDGFGGQEGIGKLPTQPGKQPAASNPGPSPSASWNPFSHLLG